MTTARIKIVVGASVDRSVDAVFASIEKRAMLAGRAVQRAMRAPGRTMAGGGEPRSTLAELDRASKTSARAVVDDQARAWRQIGKVAEQEMTRAAKAGAREIEKAQRRQESAGKAFASRTSYATARFLTPHAPLGSFAARMGGELARGFGVDFSAGAAVGRSVLLQRKAVGLAQQERMATGSTSGTASYVSAARGIADTTGVNSEQTIDMMRAFTARTGDFGAARQISGELASMGVAAGVDNLEDMGSAAGFVFSQLKGMPDAAEQTLAVMRQLAGQTAVGAVEMQDLATQAGRVAANAGKFEGSKATNIAKLGALTQLNIESGGATSAADAARATVAFANTFGKGARMKAFKSAGVELFADKAQTQYRDPFEIIKDSFRKTGGNIPQLAEMFADTLGRKPITALSDTFKAAGGGEKGIAAIEGRLNALMGASLTPETQAKNLEDYKNSAAGKAQNFQNQLDRIAESMATKVLPELEKLGPQLLAFADTVGKVTTWVVENPKTAIAGAIALSFARAGLESSVRAGVERLLLGRGEKNAAALGGAAGTFGSALTIAATAVTIASVGMLVIDKVADASSQGQKNSIASDLEVGNTVLAAELALKRGGALSGSQTAGLEEARTGLQKRITAASGQGTGWFEAAWNSVTGSGPGFAARASEQRDSEHLADLKAQMQRVEAALGKNLRVTVTNADQISAGKGSGGIDEGARTPAP